MLVRSDFAGGRWRKASHIFKFYLEIYIMDKRQFIKTAASSLLALGIVAAAAPSQAAGMGNMEKCFGVAKAGQNDCGGLSGLHSCKGSATTSYDPGDFKAVPTGTCSKMGGLTMQQAKEMLKDPAKVKAFEQDMQNRNS